MELTSLLQDRQSIGVDDPTLEDEVAEGTAPAIDTENLQAFFTGLMNRGQKG